MINTIAITKQSKRTKRVKLYVTSVCENLYVEYEMRSDRLKGKVVAVTVTSPPCGTNSETFFSRLGRVDFSSCGGACK